MDWLARLLGIATIGTDIRQIQYAVSGLSQDVRFTRESLKLLEGKIMSSFDELFAAIDTEKSEVAAELAAIKAKLDAALKDDDTDVEELLAEQSAKLAEAIERVKGISTSPVPEPTPVEPEPAPVTAEPDPIEGGEETELLPPVEPVE